MRFDPTYFWMGLITFLMLGYFGYQRYMKGGGGPVLHKATNAMGYLKQDMKEMRSKYDSVLGANDSGVKKKGKKTRRDEIRGQNRRLLENSK